MLHKISVFDAYRGKSARLKGWTSWTMLGWCCSSGLRDSVDVVFFWPGKEVREELPFQSAVFLLQ